MCSKFKQNEKAYEECRLNFVLHSITANLVLGQEFSMLLAITMKKLESKWGEELSLTKNHANFRMHVTIIKGVSRCLTRARTKIINLSLLSKDSQEIEHLIL